MNKKMFLSIERVLFYTRYRYILKRWSVPITRNINIETNIQSILNRKDERVRHIDSFWAAYCCKQIYTKKRERPKDNQRQKKTHNNTKINNKRINRSIKIHIHTHTIKLRPTTKTRSKKYFSSISDGNKCNFEKPS